MEKEKKDFKDEPKDVLDGKDNSNKRRPDRRHGNKGGKPNPKKNDWSFYAASDEIAKDTASVPFNYMGGTPFPIRGGARPAGTSQPYGLEDSLPGVCGIEYSNSIGLTNTQTEGVNMAAVQLYTHIRKSNSGAKNYEAADVMMYILAMMDIYSEFFNIKRIIGLVNKFDFYNHNLPDLIIRNAGIDPDDLRANIAQYRAKLNTYAHKINSFAVPKYFKVFDRKVYIASYLFLDSTTERAQMYQFNKVGYYKWSGTSSETGTSLVYTERFPKLKANSGTTVVSMEVKPLSEWFDDLDEQINALFLDSDALTMSGDILKAYPDAEMFQIAETSADYVTTMTHDEDILAQIENSRCLKYHDNVKFISTTGSNATLSMNVTQNNQLITFNPQISSTSVTANTVVLTLENFVLNSHKDKPDYKDVLEWTRLMQNYKIDATESQSTCKVISGGLEIVYSYLLSNYNFGSDNTKLLDSHREFGNFVNSSFPSSAYINIAHMMQFDWHPIMFIFGNVSGGSFHVAGDLKIATVIANDIMNRINEAACYGAFYRKS